MKLPLVFFFEGMPVVYHEEPEVRMEKRPGAAGGELTIPIPTGRTTLVARVLGGEQIDITPALRAAIDAEIARQAEKERAE